MASRAFAFLSFVITLGLGLCEATNPFLPEPLYPTVGFQQTAIPINFERRGLSATIGITSLPVDLWYPSNADPSDPFTNLNPAQIDIPLIFSTLRIPISETFGPSVNSVYENIPIVPNESLPVIIFSHGSGSLPFSNVFLFNELAQQGFVVVVIDHLGNSGLDAVRFFGQEPDSLVDVAFNRVGDIFCALDGVRSKFPAGSIDIRKTSVIGHSAGAASAVLAGLDARADPRIQAVVAIAPFPTNGYDQLDLPTLFMSGSADLVIPADVGIDVIRDALSLRTNPPTTYLVDFNDAAHNSFTDICYLQDALEAARNDSVFSFFVEFIIPIVAAQADRSCKQVGIADFETVNQISAMYTVAFLKTELDMDDTNTYAVRLSETFARQNNFDLVYSDTQLSQAVATIRPSARPTPSPTTKPTSFPTITPTRRPTRRPTPSPTPPRITPSPTRDRPAPTPFPTNEQTLNCIVVLEKTYCY